ncbi:MAG: MMPL family transporter [Deltaproteobacteria bacterium]|nr:MMPL family transporter [Deltaproteobacteria bacterium]
MTAPQSESNDQEKALYRVGEWLIDNRRWASIVTIAFTAFMTYESLQLEMFTSFGELLPYRHPFVAVHNTYARQFGGANNITIMFEVKEGTIFTKDTLTRIFAATREVDLLPDINHDQIDSIGHRTTRYLTMQGGSISSPPVMRRPPVTEKDVEQVRSIVHYSENIHGILVSLDDQAALIRANFHEGRINYRQIFYDINRNIIERYQDDNTKIWVAGEPRLYGWIYRYSNDVFWILVITYAIEWVLRWMYFHDWRGSLRPTITGILAAVWGLGFINLIGFALDPLMLVVPFLITARAVSHAIQMHDRYDEEYQKNAWDKRKAIVAAFAELFVPTVSGIVTDALGVLVILLIPVVMLQKLAITASWWIFAITVSEVLLNPIVYFYLKAPEPEMVILREEGWFRRFMDRLTDLTLSRAGRMVTLAFWGGVAVLSLIFLRGLTIGDPTAASPLLWQDSAYNQSHTRIQQFFGGVEPLIVVVEGKTKKALQEPKALEAMEAFQRYVDADPEIGYSFSLADIVKSINMVFFDTDPRWGVIPEEVGRIANLFFFYFAGSPPSETSKYLDPSYTNGHVTFFCRNHQGDTVARIIARCRDYIGKFPAEKIDFRLAGGLIGVTAAANEEIVRNDILMNVLGLATIYLILLFTYRSFAAGIYMLLPLFVSNAFVNAYMSVRDIGVNLHTLPVVTVGIGFGIDYGLYIVSRIIEEIRVTGDLYDATKTALCTTGKGVTFTAVTMVMSTLFWTSSNIRFDAEMGGLLAMWMAISFVASQTLMPALILVFKPKFITREMPVPAASTKAATA